MASISQNQYDYLNNLVKAGGGDGEWAKQQLSSSTYTPPTPQQASQGTIGSNSTVYAPSAASQNQTSAYTPPTTGMSHQNNTVYAPQYTQDQLAHQSWINNESSGQGGLANYTNTQQSRYNDAFKSGDADLLGRLQADSQRVGYTLNAPTMPKTVYAPAAPSSNDGNRAYNVGTDADRDAEARRRVEQAIAEKRRIADQQKTGLQTTYDRLRQDVGETRALENSQNQRNLNPFSGRSDYAQGMIARERARTDREQQADLATRSANVDELLAGYENASEEERKRIVDELVRQDRSFGLEQGSLTGNYNGSRTLAGAAQDYNQARQTKIDNWNAYMDSVGLTGNLGTGAKADWSLLGSTGGAPTLAAKSTLLQQEGQRINNEIANLELQNYPAEQKLKIQQLQKQIAQIGAAPYKDATDAEYDKIKLDTAREQLRQLKEKPSETSKVDYKNSPDFASDVAYLKSNPDTASNQLDTHAQEFISQYGYDGYLALRKAAGLD